MDSLWPATTAILGVYDHPPPDGSSLNYRLLEPGPITDDFFTKQGVKTAKALTRLKDYLGGLL